MTQKFRPFLASLTRGPKSDNLWPRFSTPVDLKALWFRNKATVLNLTGALGAPTIGVSFPKLAGSRFP